MEKQQMESNYQNELLKTKLEVQEQAFKYLSEEIHDNVGQVLSLTKLHLYNIQTQTQEATTKQSAQESAELLGKAINDLRTISHTLNTGFIAKAGLKEAIEKELRYVQSAKNIQCKLLCSGDIYYLGDEKEVLIFRIVQEAIANAIKHADATQIEVQLAYRPDMLTVAVKDNGKGFDASTRAKADGIGMNNMEVRANLLKAKLNITSSAGSGTTILLEIQNGHGNE